MKYTPAMTALLFAISLVITYVAIPPLSAEETAPEELREYTMLIEGMV